MVDRCALQGVPRPKAKALSCIDIEFNTFKFYITDKPSMTNIVQQLSTKNRGK